ncbi:bacillithiol biosynthesis cysteine-adding enzyme BshC [Alkalihalobacillus sp. LMS39]|uniref:bacillithiol biosynthesis cysteine-adding enzyme BshC n=1 Tax=Alkalihalobacillus sp. LMS39 TaxID=2924032 RepID=UPI001FB409E5|nr:bacillithiol biosynthesis cysteine-adding enzyme BshC [Alkalihalobacillus sp. LMS39]UOE92938.1 bacillithiol biosynthesis cysteine-adding enzyme BshC [Alkalihalobacillus sp. LMS39]
MNVKASPLSPFAKIANDYSKANTMLLSFFDYYYKENNVYSTRYKELSNRKFERNRLANILVDYHKKLTYHQKALEQIERLKDERSVLVVGGQQPGVLMGPLFTYYKALTVVQLAKQQEEELGVPVIPLFWVAGEDHDFNEINHVYVEEKKSLMKFSLAHQHDKKTSLSDLHLETENAHTWVRDVFLHMNETEHTRSIFTVIESCLQKATTYTDFFSELISWVFREEGLVLLDSGAKEIRKLESSLFTELIENNEELQRLFIEQSTKLEKQGYPLPVTIDQTNANLFYLENGKREKVRKEAGVFRTNSSIFSKQQFLAIANESPELLSNNVVTRPIMQEYLLPVLAFVAGPGEIAYWATLKSVFHLFSYKVPPIVPRKSITIVEEKVDRWMQEKKVTIADVFEKKVSEKKTKWLQQHNEWDVVQIKERVMQDVKVAHEPLRAIAKEIDDTSATLAQKNLGILFHEIEKVTNKIEHRIKVQYNSELRKFDEIEKKLFPLGIPQERVYHLFYYLNEYGEEFLTRTKELNFDNDGFHKLVYP